MEFWPSSDPVSTNVAQEVTHRSRRSSCVNPHAQVVPFHNLLGIAGPSLFRRTNEGCQSCLSYARRCPARAKAQPELSHREKRCLPSCRGLTARRSSLKPLPYSLFKCVYVTVVEQNFGLGFVTL